MWQHPKLDWNPSTPAGETDFNRWEGNPYDLHLRQGNLSFEYMDNAINPNPDGWDITTPPGDSFALDAANAVHGSYCLKLSHSGIVNNGIIAISQLFPISPLNAYYIGWAMMVPNGALQCDIQVAFYDRAKQYISTMSLYSSANNLTSMAYYIGQVTNIPANARYMVIAITAGYNSSIPGDLYIDGIQINPIEIAIYKGVFNALISRADKSNYGSYTTVASQVINPSDIKLSNGVIRTNVYPLNITVNYNISVGGNEMQYTGYARGKVGDAYSNVITATTPTIGSSRYGIGSASGSYTFTVQSLPATVELQLKGQMVNGTCSIGITV